MQCDICTRPPSSRLPFICANCARKALYNPRKDVAAVERHKEALEKDIEKFIGSSNAVGKVSSSSPARGKQRDTKTKMDGTRFSLDSLESQDAKESDRAAELTALVDAVKAEIKNKKAMIQEQKRLLAQRREDLDTARRNSPPAQPNALDSVKQSVGRKDQRWDMMHDATVDARSFLCREAANLYRLQQRRRRKRDGNVREEFRLGGIPIVDLRELNNIQHSRITASLTGISYLVVLVSQYLSLRLPAEITLPHRDYPLPTIFSQSSSYTLRKVQFPRHTPAQSSNTSPSGSRLDLRHLPRPRPLYLDKPLPTLAKEDPVAYSLFIEGVTYLAWDIAWICQTQGLDVGDKGWEDICSLGKNLWLLLVAKLSRPSGAPTPSSANPGNSALPSKLNSTPSPPPPTPTLGHYSHGSAHSFLASADGSTQLLRDWRLKSPLKLVDQVKSYLLGDMTGAEWEVLEEREWEGEADAAAAAAVEDEAVIVEAAPQQSFDQGHAGDTFFDVRGPGDGEGTGTGTGTEGEARPVVDRTKGWTKLKSRS